MEEKIKLIKKYLVEYQVEKYIRLLSTFNNIITVDYEIFNIVKSNTIKYTIPIFIIENKNSYILHILDKKQQSIYSYKLLNNEIQQYKDFLLKKKINEYIKK